MEHKPEQPSKLKRNILSIGIAIVFVMLVAVGIDTFYGSSPDWNDYCNDTYKGDLSNQSSCLAADGKWQPAPVEKSPVGVNGYCDLYYKCQPLFDQANEVYNRDVFIISLIFGTIAIILGGVILSLESVSSGIMAGGVLTVIYGTIRYWGEMSQYIRFVILALVLAVLVWIGYKKLKG